MKKIKIGVIGGYRGTSMISFLKGNKDAEVVAICDKNDDILKMQMESNAGLDIKYLKDYDEMLKLDIDAVVLANYAHQHAPFAIKALKAGKHVFSEVLPCQTLKEAVELVEAVEETGKIYAYGENYCYMPAPYEMKKLYKQGVLGEFEYGEGEYIHNCEPIWADITYGEKDHWRNKMYSTFYCTHSLGPIIHITGLRPVSVVGFEGANNTRCYRVGRRSAEYGVEMVTLENGSIVRSVHGGLYKNSVWYSIYGSKGRAESGREDAGVCVERLYLNVDEYDGEYANRPPKNYCPELPEEAQAFGHGGSDYFSMLNFIKKIKGDEDADIIDVYEALDMSLPGVMAFRSILAGGIPMEVPNMRDKAVREKYRNDTACTDEEVAGDMLIPTKRGGTPEIPDEIYDVVRKKYERTLVEGSDYRTAVKNQGVKKK